MEVKTKILTTGVTTIIKNNKVEVLLPGTENRSETYNSLLQLWVLKK